jgi:hypothetical protein
MEEDTARSRESHVIRVIWGRNGRYGADGGGRTHTPFREPEPKSGAAANYATSALGGVDNAAQEPSCPTITFAYKSMSRDRGFGVGLIRPKALRRQCGAAPPSMRSHLLQHGS